MRQCRCPAPAWLVLAVLLRPTAMVLAGPSAATAATERPNVVLIISDDQRFDDFGFMGNRFVQTPHLDDLAARSAGYLNGYVPSSVCRPSLATLLTGLYPHQHGIYFNHPPPGFAKLTRSPDIDKQRFDVLRRRAARRIRAVPTLPRILAAHGYRCFQTGKYWEGHWSNAGFTAGMTTAEPSGGKYGDKQLANGDWVAHGNGDHGLVIGRETLQPIFAFLDETVAAQAPQGLGDSGRQPFLIWYAPFLPHTPHDAPRRYFEMYEERDGVPEHRVPYYAAISQFDETVGELLEGLQQRGLLENTLFVFVVDNGWEPDPERFIAARDEWDHTKRSKRSPFEPGLRTPILLRWDGHISPATHKQLVSSVDIVPTVLSAVGIPHPKRPALPGRDLMPSAQGQASLPEQRAVFGEIYPGDASSLGHPERDIAYRWVRRGSLKLIVPHAHSQGRPWNRYLDRTALFDLASDPRETRNLAEDPAYEPKRRELEVLLDAWWTP